ncbi:uncharacterized protein LOC119580699 [Penaeus monodon]|uniref:uncharacterized protein LOC119580699 n=1 Tax=Penaeus monodon TaxID=6687 RepID=UPI0018A6EAC6|nr:uncharacterized protein LOC119580699 [Penaeus monodon]
MSCVPVCACVSQLRAKVILQTLAHCQVQTQLVTRVSVNVSTENGAWKNTDCEKGQARCRANGGSECIPIEDYCHRTQTRLPRNSRPSNLLCDAYNKSVDLGSELRSKLNDTLSHPNCPRFYTEVGGQCLSLFYVGRSSWGEARAFCKHIGGDLLSIRNINHYMDLVNHLVENQPAPLILLLFSLDGTTSATRENVTVVGTSKVREANHGECYHVTQAPENPPKGFCAAITYENHYYMSDEDCLTDMSPICVTSV